MSELVFPEGTWVLAAHPDDETIGAGASLARARGSWIVHLTTGAPADRNWWPEEFRTRSRDAYAGARAAEARAALALAGVAPERILSLAGEDQGAFRQLTALTRRFAERIQGAQPARILTHPYEGGHPDHDAAAFVAHAAGRILERRGARPPPLWEMTSYHARGADFVAGEFLGDQSRVIACELSPGDRALKQRMVEAYASQSESLRKFHFGTERFRPAPAYDFRTAPHEGQLHYERMSWAAGEEWRRHAAVALEELGLGADGCF